MVEAILSAMGKSGADRQAVELAERVIAEARVRWPGVEPAPDALRAQLSVTASAEGANDDAWAALCWPDMWLAAACASGDQKAIQTFLRAFLPDLKIAHRRMGARAPAFDDFSQTLTEKLFAGAAPRICGCFGREQGPAVALERESRYSPPMRRNRWSSLACAVLAAAAVSCSGASDNPNLTDVAEQYSKAYCIKLEVCMDQAYPGTFAKVYPGGQDDCASRTLSISGTSEKSICTQEQWDQCATDLAGTCAGQNLDGGGSPDGGPCDPGAECVGPPEARRPKIPDSCQGC